MRDDHNAGDRPAIEEVLASISSMSFEEMRAIARIIDEEPIKPSNLLFKLRLLLQKALEEKQIKEVGSGFGMGEADIDFELDGRTFCVTLTLRELR